MGDDLCSDLTLDIAAETKGLEPDTYTAVIDMVWERGFWSDMSAEPQFTIQVL